MFRLSTCPCLITWSIGRDSGKTGSPTSIRNVIPNRSKWFVTWHGIVGYYDSSQAKTDSGGGVPPKYPLHITACGARNNPGMKQPGDTTLRNAITQGTRCWNQFHSISLPPPLPPSPPSPPPPSLFLRAPASSWSLECASLHHCSYNVETLVIQHCFFLH